MKMTENTAGQAVVISLRKTFFVHLSVFGLTVMYASYKFLEFVFRETSKAGL